MVCYVNTLHMFSSYCTLYLASHRMLIDIMYAWDSPGIIWASFATSWMPSMYRLHVCVYLSLDPSGKLMEIGLLVGCTLFTGFSVRKKFPVAPASAMASCFVIYIIDGEYAVSICLFFRLLMIVVLSSPS